MDYPPKIFIDFYDVFQRFTKRVIPGITNDIEKIVLPLFPQQLMCDICQAAHDKFKEDSQIMMLDGEIVTVGDLHGHLVDLFRIFQKFGWPPHRRYLFLGDIIDRGEFSIETITIVLLAKILYPHHVFVIRGNHEFPDMYSRGGFLAEIQHLYKESSIEKHFFQCFSEIPIAAIINKKILCIHGGIGPSVETIDDIKKIPKPLFDYSDEPQQTILWSDPNEYSEKFEPSSRGVGYFFGEDSLKAFLEKNNFSLLVRGHECVEKGVELFFKKKCMTVFSASRYCDSYANKAGVTTFKDDCTYEITTFPPVKTYLLRSKAQFSPIDFFFKSIENIKQAPAVQQAATGEKKLPFLLHGPTNYNKVSHIKNSSSTTRRMTQTSLTENKSLPLLSSKKLSKQKQKPSSLKRLPNNDPLY